jgi:bifunctional UDP-N-acetylglucosamine pyrophosphorylase/glucosamine-1-phosphate N-acetyltransferase
MDAIILAAGLGTRLRPHTLTTPKPLLPIQGRPILDWTLAALPKSISRVIVVTHYLADQVDAYLRSQYHFRNWQTVFQETPRGTGDALMACRSAVQSSQCLVLNGDDLYAAKDLARLATKSAGLLAHPVDDPSRFGIVFPRPDGTLDRMVEKPKMQGRMMANIGAYLFPQSVFALTLPLSERGEYEITDAVSMIAQREPFHIIEATTWLPIGTEEAWRAAEGLDLQSLIVDAEPIG